MRILHIDTGRAMRGGQWQVLHLLEGLAARGHEPVLLARAGAPLVAHARAKGLDARPLGLPTLWRLSRRVQVTHAHDARAHTLAVLTGTLPLVVSRRVAFPVSRSPLSRWKYQRAHRYVAVSEFVRDRLIEAGVPPTLIAVVYDGVRERAPSRESMRIVAPATEDPRKGSALLGEAAGRAGLSVHFSSDLEADLADAGVFVYLTWEEGLGSAVLMAMSAGVPVVASRVGGLPEIVEDGRTGLLTRNDPDSVAGAIRRLLDDRPLAAAMAERARRRVRECFSVSAMLDGTLAAYKDAAESIMEAT